MLRPLLTVTLLSLLAFATAQQIERRTYTIQDGLSQMKVSALHLDSRGNLWVGTRNGLNRFNGESFEVLTTTDGLLSNRIHDIREGEDGELIILTSGGINIYDGAEMRSYPYEFLGVVYNMVTGPDSVIWINEEAWIRLWKLQDGSISEVSGLGNVQKIALDPQTRSVLAVIDQKRYRLDRAGAHLLADDPPVLPHPGMSRLGGSNVVTTGPLSDLYICYLLSDGLDTVVQVRETTWTDFKPNDVWLSRNLQIYLPYQDGHIVMPRMPVNVTDVLMDSLRRYWIGSDNGLTLAYLPVFEHYPSEILPNVWTIIEDKNGAMWFGTYGNGLYRWPKDEEKPVPQPELTGDMQNFFLGAATDEKGRLYFSSVYGLLRIAGNTVQRLTVRPVFTAVHDPNSGDIVFGIEGGIGILDTSTDTIRIIDAEDGLHVNNYIQSITIDRAGCYWLGSYTGMSRYCPQDGGVTSYTHVNGRLPANNVFATVQMTDEHLWMGGDGGLMLYHFDQDTIQRIPSSVLPSLVKSLIALDSTYLLIGAKDGLYALDTRTFLRAGEQHMIPLNTSTGYQGVEPGFNGFYRDNAGDIWVMSATSVDKFDPRRLPLTDSVLAVRILAVNDEIIPFASDAIPKIAFGRTDVQITFEAIGFIRSATTQYQYRLDNGAWSPWQPDGRAFLTDLTDGRHTFEVRAGPTDLPPDATPVDMVKFDVDLAFYQSQYFPAIAGILLVILLGLTLFYFLKQRSARRLYTAQLEEARYLRNQLLLSELNPHFIFNVLASIQNKIITDKTEAASDYIVRLSKLIRNFLNATYRGNVRNSPEYEISLETEISLLQSFIEFEVDKSNAHFSYEIIVADGLNPQNVMLPPMLLQPFVENAIKHGLSLRTPGGHLTLKFQYFKDAMVCTIADDGVGREAARKIRASAFDTHRSLGSQIVAERVELLNQLGYDIKVQTEDREPRGTIVTVTIKDA